MIKVFAASALLAIAMVAPAYAQDMACDEATLTKMKGDIDAVADAAKKEAGMKEHTMAMEAMQANKMDECKMHMGEAEKSLK